MEQDVDRTDGSRTGEDWTETEHSRVAWTELDRSGTLILKIDQCRSWSDPESLPITIYNVVIVSECLQISSISRLSQLSLKSAVHDTTGFTCSHLLTCWGSLISQPSGGMMHQINQVCK